MPPYNGMPTSPQISKSVNQMSRRKASRLLFALLPSFIQPLLTQTPSKPIQIHATSWVDGMRGVASFIVFICHTASPFHDRQDWGYGTIEPEAADNQNNLWLAQLPIIKLIYSGGPMVNLFFVISGFALSYKPIRLLRDHDWERLFQTMTSATFRRCIRITCPMIVSTFMALFLNRIYVYEFFRPYNSGLPYRFPALSNQLWNWMSQTGHQMDFLYGPNERVFNEYGPQTWTISLELKGSFVLFLLIIALCRARIHLRFLVLLTLCWHCVIRGYWEYFCFISGMILTELDFIRQEAESAKQDIASKRTSTRPFISNSKWILIFVISLFLMSSPNKYPNLCPGYKLLDSFNPLPGEHPRFWPIIGAILCIWSVGNCMPLQSLFTNRFSQYLGQISYPLYLTHGIITDTMDFYVINKAWGFTGADTVFRYELGWTLMFVISLPVAFWVADLFWRGVDVKSVALSRWVERRFCYS